MLQMVSQLMLGLRCVAGHQIASQHNFQLTFESQQQLLSEESNGYMQSLD